MRPSHRGLRQPAKKERPRRRAAVIDRFAAGAQKRLPRPHLWKTDKRMPDYMYILESRLSAEQRAAMMRVQELAAEAGSNLYLTGGAVRDLVSGMAIRDLDFTIEGNPSRVAREIEKGGAHDRQRGRETPPRRADLFRRRRRQHLRRARRRLRSSRNALRDPLVDDHGGSPPARFLDQRHRHLSECGLARLAARSHQRPGRRREEGSARAIDSQLHESAGAAAAGDALRRAHGFQARVAHRGVVCAGAWSADWRKASLRRTSAGSCASLAREEKPAAILKAWEARGLIGTIHPQLARRHPDYEMLARIVRARDEVVAAGLRPAALRARSSRRCSAG